MGIGGNTIRDLDNRWEADVIEQKPDWLSVSIGINDVWRQVDKRDDGVPVEEFEATYRRLLTRTQEATSSKLILMETTVIGESPEDEGNQLLKPYNEVIAKLLGGPDVAPCSDCVRAPLGNYVRPVPLLGKAVGFAGGRTETALVSENTGFPATERAKTSVPSVRAVTLGRTIERSSGFCSPGVTVWRVVLPATFFPPRPALLTSSPSLPMGSVCPHSTGL